MEDMEQKDLQSGGAAVDPKCSLWGVLGPTWKLPEGFFWEDCHPQWSCRWETALPASTHQAEGTVIDTMAEEMCSLSGH